MKNKKLVISIGVLIVLIAVFVGLFLAFRPKTTKGDKGYTVEVVDDEGKSKKYDGSTDAEYLRGVMDELQKDTDFSYAGDESEYGLYIKTINGVTADYDKDGAYWSIMVNGEYGMYGADSQPVTDGDNFSFIYTK